MALRKRPEGSEWSWRQPLPPQLETQYQQFVRARSASVLERSVYGLIAVYLVVVLPISLLSQDQALGFWQRCVVWPIGVVLISLWLTTRVGMLRRHVTEVLALAVAASLVGTLYCNMNLDSGAFAQITSYQSIYILIIAFSILRIPAQVALASSLGAFCLAALASWAGGARLDLLAMLLSYMVPLVLCLVVGLLLENSDRQNFLHEQQLAEEARRIEHMHAETEQALAIQQRHAAFLTLIAGNLDVETLFSRVLGYIVEHTGAQVAVAHLVEPGALLRRVASWGAERADGETVDAQQSLMGEALRLGRMLQLEQVPEGYLQIRSAALVCRPAAVLILPVGQAEQQVAAIELGRTGVFDPQEQSFLESLCAPLAFAASAAMARRQQTV